MELLQRITSTISSSFASFCQLDSLYQLDYVHETLPPRPASFPQFARLPIEIRIRIWELSLEPRIISLHLHRSSIHDVPPDDSSDSDVDCSGENTQLALISNEEVEGKQTKLRKMRLRRDPMSITHCAQCRCHSYPPRSSHVLPLPAVTLVCRESRDVTFKSYSRRLDKEYNNRGVPVTSGSQTAFSEVPYNTLRAGVVINPTVDIIQLQLNVASGSELNDLMRFAPVAAKQLADIRRAIVRITIAMPPYQWNGGRYEKWRNWGADGSWVPRSLLKLKNLREIAILIERNSSMLPTEWRVRTLSIWHQELEKRRQKWPAQWEGVMPRLRVISKLEEL